MRRRRLLLGAGVVVAAALAAWAWPRRQPARYESLDAILDGYGLPRQAVVQLPDTVGPYAVINVVIGHEGEPISGWFEANGQRRRFSVPAEKSVFFEVVGLEPADGGGPTFAVVRRPIAKSANEQK
jgi:hypothetical protein